MDKKEGSREGNTKDNKQVNQKTVESDVKEGRAGKDREREREKNWDRDEADSDGTGGRDKEEGFPEGYRRLYPDLTWSDSDVRRVKLD